MNQSQRGGTMVETSIVMLLALTLIFGAIEFSRALYTYHALSNGARLGTRYAIVHGANCKPSGCTATQSTIQDYIRSQTLAVNSSNLTATAAWTGTDLNGGTCSSTSEQPGCTVTVTVNYTFTFIVPFLGPSTGLAMSSSSKMVVSN